MAADIVPQLYENIHKEFELNISKSMRIQKFLNKLENNKATSKDVAFYSADLGVCAGNALLKYMTPDNMPNGTLYWNIAQRTITPLLEEVNELVVAAAVNVQKQEDRKNKIGLNPVKSKLSQGRIDGFIRQLIKFWEDEYGK